MARGYDTSRLVIETRVIKEIVAGCDRPDVLKAILEQARELAFRRTTVDAFNEFCEAQPCVLWQPEDLTSLINVRVKREIETVPIKVARIVWTITHVCAQQGEMLRGHEELHHNCGHNGKGNNAWGACLNPSHLIRGGAEFRAELKKVRNILEKRGLMKVAV